MVEMCCVHLSSTGVAKKLQEFTFQLFDLQEDVKKCQIESKSKTPAADISDLIICTGQDLLQLQKAADRDQLRGQMLWPDIFQQVFFQC